MIAFVQGTVYSYDSESVIVSINGLGYRVYFNPKTPLELGSSIFLYTYHQFLEDGQNLFGFLTLEEKTLFEQLIKVKKLGPKTAMKILANDSYQRIIQSIEAGDVAYLQRLPGIGKAMASQIVLDLKGKLVAEEIKEVQDPELADALEALKTLGYHPRELQSIIKPLKESEAKTSDEYLKLGLQLMRGK